MKWKQFFTPAKSIDASQTKDYLSNHAQEEYTLLDVRQPSEYKESHLPGATLIPLPELSDRLDEIDPAKPVLVYWAIGGRSRVAAQMLAGKGFESVLNVSGGIKAYEGNVAVGAPDEGLHLFSGKESIEDTLVAAYSLEQGLRQFYLSMASETPHQEIQRLFSTLADIEIIHQENLLKQFRETVQMDITKEDIEKKVDDTLLEGGMTSQEYMDRFNVDLTSSVEVISMAMSIEAQALDLYERAARRSSDDQTKRMLGKIANEEKQHLKHLGDLMASL